VGKSTLFNRLLGERSAIVDDFSGVTRDRLYGSCDWNGKTFTVIDTGGFVPSSSDVFESAIRAQVRTAIEEASVVLLMVDVTTGITDIDEEVARILRKTDKPSILAVNKVDNHARMLAANEFWSLGFEETYFISSITGSGSGDLLDAITEKLPDATEEENEDELPRIAFIGQPNVGKSSMVNALLGEERNIVTDVAGTTRDSLHSEYNKFGKHLTLIDTAGIRKKNVVKENLEFYSVIRAIRALEEADVCMLMIDATLGIEAQDMNLLGEAIKRKKGLVILVNKWDLVKKETNTARDFEENLKRKLAPFTDVPVLFISVHDKQRIYKAIDVALEVYDRKTQRIKTSKLNEVMLKAIEKTPPPTHRGRFIKIKYVTQLPAKYPAFAFFCNHPTHVKASYKNYLENQLRKAFNFTGVPIAIYFRQK
jgi:GTP-binding protein